MIIKKDGKELKNALVRYGADGTPVKIIPDMTKSKVWQPIEGYSFEEKKIAKKTKVSKAKKTK